MKDAPTSMTRLPVDHRGFYVPFFITEKDENGHWDFVHILPNRTREVLKKEKCWLSGEALGRYRSFVIGPMCCINRITAEPPSKRECAEFAVRVCPFMINPTAKRPKLKDGDPGFAPGVMDPRNPGVICVWTVERGGYMMDRDNLIHLGEPSHISFYTEGRKASNSEVRDAMRSGAKRLLVAAMTEGAEAVDLCSEMIVIAGNTIRNYGGYTL